MSKFRLSLPGSEGMLATDACVSCPAACCRDVNIGLSSPDAAMLHGLGTKLVRLSEEPAQVSAVPAYKGLRLDESSGELFGLFGYEVVLGRTASYRIIGLCGALGEVTNNCGSRPCMIYDKRPSICKTYQAASKLCLERRIAFSADPVQEVPTNTDKSPEAKEIADITKPELMMLMDDLNQPDILVPLTGAELQQGMIDLMESVSNEEAGSLLRDYRGGAINPYAASLETSIPFLEPVFA